MTTVLVLDPHSDDWVNCCGTIQGHIRRGDEILMLALSGCSVSLTDGYTLVDYHKEWKESLRVIGIEPDDTPMGKHWFADSFPVRRFSEHRQSLLDLLIMYRSKYEPDIIYCPSLYDLHQDHNVVALEAVRAFWKSASVYGYDAPWNRLECHTNHFVSLSERDVDIKVDVASVFKSQTCKQNTALSEKFIRSLAVVNGNRIRVNYAEGFQLIRSRVV